MMTCHLTKGDDMNQDEFFKAVLKRAVDNPIKCMKNTGKIMYKHEGNSCFIGDFMTQEEADKGDLSGLTISGLYDEGLVPASLQYLDVAKLLAVQKVHDAVPSNHWVRELEVLQEEYANQ